MPYIAEMEKMATKKLFHTILAGLPARIFDKYVIIVSLIALLVMMPIISLVIVALGSNFDSLIHIATTILPRATFTTIILLIGVALLTGFIGAISAWLVSFFDFPGRKIFAFAMILPLSVPTYISSYAFVEFFGFSGPIQSLIRTIFGFNLSRDYWFFEIRSLGGAIFVLSMVLYPYVFLLVRSLFLLQGRKAVEAGEVLGAKKTVIFTKILLPLARPALVLGIILVMMEAINDIGAMEYLGVKTLTLSIFSIWINQADFAGAAQIALVLLFIVLLLILFERFARKKQQYSEIGKGNNPPFFTLHKLRGAKKWLAFLACFAPIALGFGVPFFVLGNFAIKSLKFGFDLSLLTPTFTSIILASLAAFFTIIIALFLSYALRIRGTKLVKSLVRLASIGYAIPGTIIALGIFLPLAKFDNIVDFYMRDWFGISTGLLITGSGVTLIYAYIVRFMAIAEGTTTSAFQKISKNLDDAAILFGRSNFATFREILLPILRPAIFSAALLVFIDTLKELSATIMLRPFGVETLSIYIHDLASRGRIEQASIASIIIMSVGIFSLFLLSKSLKVK